MGPPEVNNMNNVREAKYPPFEEFCRFLKTEAGIAYNPITSLQATKEEDSNGNGDKWKPNSKFPKNKDSKDSGFTSFATGADETKEGRGRNREAKRTICLFYKVTHDIDTNFSCDKFLCLPLTERRNFVQANACAGGA